MPQRVRCAGWLPGGLSLAVREEVCLQLLVPGDQGSWTQRRAGGQLGEVVGADVVQWLLCGPVRFSLNLCWVDLCSARCQQGRDGLGAARPGPGRGKAAKP